jgi:hypothetical protein
MTGVQEPEEFNMQYLSVYIRWNRRCQTQIMFGVKFTSYLVMNFTYKYYKHHFYHYSLHLRLLCLSAQPCIALHSLAQPCIALHSLVQPCIALYTALHSLEIYI